MRTLLALLLAAALGGAAAHAGEPACADAASEVAAVDAGHDEPSHGCGDCGAGCTDCTCCRAPLGVTPRAARPTPHVTWAPLGDERASLEGVRPASDIFQPPRA